jgi:hypothetical protein
MGSKIPFQFPTQIAHLRSRNYTEYNCTSLYPHQFVIHGCALLIIHLYQSISTTLLNGFTIQEVDVCGAWSTGDAKPSDLALPFHPIYDRKAWFVGKTVKLDPFYTQIWDVTKEEELWNLSKPSLRLATLMLTTAGLSPW